MPDALGISVLQPATARCCANCACYFVVPNPQNPMQSQGFCRREPANTAQVAVEVPMVNGKGEVMMQKDKTGREVPRMERRQQMAYVFDLTNASSVCFDGWRPLGTQPGDDWRAHWFAKMVSGALEEHGEDANLEPGELLELVKSWAKGPALPSDAANDPSHGRLA
jgi:hypothetical protein